MSTILNPGTSPVTYTDDARIIEPGTRLYGVTLDGTGHGAVTRGDIVEEVGNDAPPTTGTDAPPVTDDDAADAPADAGGQSAQA